MRVGIVGRGRAARTLVPLMEPVDLELEWWWSRRDTRQVSDLRRVDVVLFAVPDDQVEYAAISLAIRPSALDEIWLHLSGALPAARCRPSPEVPRAVGCLHPLQALPGREVKAGHLQGVVAGIEGEDGAVEVAEDLARRLGMIPRRIRPGTKALYHAGAVMAAGHVTASFEGGLRLLEACGFSRDEARQALYPLLRGTTENLENRGPEAVITGPVARGDVGTLRSHLEAINQEAPEMMPLYGALAAAALEISAGELDPEVVRALKEVLSNDRP